MLNLSTGAVARLLAGEAFAALFNAGAIFVYGGDQPVSADAEVGAATLLARITPDGAAFTPGSGLGLTFTAVGRYVVKTPVQTWVMSGVATGTAAWFRLVGNAVDTGGASLAAVRLDGACSLLADPHIGLILPSLAITPTYQREVEQFAFTL